MQALAEARRAFRLMLASRKQSPIFVKRLVMRHEGRKDAGSEWRPQ
jgi:hypothetical protein